LHVEGFFFRKKSANQLKMHEEIFYANSSLTQDSNPHVFFTHISLDNQERERDWRELILCVGNVQKYQVVYKFR
jgi:hypothetical protein